MESEIKKAWQVLAAYEIPRKMILLTEAFTPENGILTPTMKLKRHEVHKRYGNKIEALYTEQ